MATAIRPIGHEERLSLVEHLDELRTRLIVSAVALAVAFGFCLWQNHALLKIINKPLTTQTQKQVAKGHGTTGQAVLAQQGVRSVGSETRAALGVLVKAGSGLSSSARAELLPLIAALRADIAKLPRAPQGDLPVTLGVGEPFTTTLTVALGIMGFPLPPYPPPPQLARIRPQKIPVTLLSAARCVYTLVPLKAKRCVES